MCGRFVIKASAEDIQVAFRVDNIIAKVENNYNVAMTDMIYAVTQEDSTRSLISVQWDLMPVWLKPEDAKQNKEGRWIHRGRPWYNSTSEKFLTLPNWKRFWKRRCLIVATWWGEFPKIDGVATPHLFGLESQELMAFAGHYDYWKAPDGKEVVGASIITTEANKLVAKYHPQKRMPVILDKAAQDVWLDPANQDAKIFERILKPLPDEELVVFQISREFNKVGNRSPEFIKPVA